ITSAALIHIYVITKHPKRKEFAIVMPWCENGDLGKFLPSLQTYNDVYLKNFHIASGLAEIHSKGFCHKDLHTGNILLHANKQAACISHLGLCGPVHECDNQVAGVLPYMAPEILCGDRYTQKVDIYSLGI